MLAPGLALKPMETSGPYLTPCCWLGSLAAAFHRDSCDRRTRHDLSYRQHHGSRAMLRMDIAFNVQYRPCILAPAKLPTEHPCPFHLPEILTVRSSFGAATLLALTHLQATAARVDAASGPLRATRQSICIQLRQSPHRDSWMHGGPRIYLHPGGGTIEVLDMLKL